MEKSKRRNKKYSAEFKISVILDMLSNQLNYHEVVRKYWGEDVEIDSYRITVRHWERIYSEEGAEGFMKERRVRSTKADSPNKGRPPKSDKQVEKDLMAENQRLRMEIEYLKKLSALVLAEEQEKSKKQ